MNPRPEPPRRRRLNRLLRRLAIVGTVAMLWALVGILATVWWFGRGADDIDLGPLVEYRPPQITRVLARDGTPIGEIGSERRTLVRWAQLPDTLVDAFVAAEDSDFFEHEGLDWSGIARATLNNLAHGEARQGASTITQQVIKNTLLGPARTLERKSQELWLAGRVESLLDKQEIFTIYVNAIYLGEGCHGVERAARHYFGKSVEELDLGESALLAALPRSPGLVTPYRQPELLEARRKHVLSRMVALGLADLDDVRGHMERPPAVLPRNHPRDRAAFGDADEFVALARRELVRLYGEDQLARLGATVWTSVDLEVQRAARLGGRVRLDELEQRHGHGGHARQLADKARQRLHARAPAELAVGQSHTVVVVSHDHAAAGWLDAELGPHRIRIELPTGTDPATRMPIGWALTVQITALGDGASAAIEAGPEMALALADVASGELRALIGGREFVQGNFDRSRSAQRQPGSAFKPVLYGAAIRTRRFTAASRGHGGPHGEPMRLREALAQSDNAVALALLAAIGPDPVHEFATDLGLTSPLGRQPSLALGTSEVSPLELLTGYLTLARGGVGIDPKAVTAIEIPADLQGRRPTPTGGPEPVRTFGIDAEVAGVVTSMLRSVVDEGTGMLAAQLGRPVAGKTGTTDDSRDAWFAGYTPDHVAVAWVGFDRPRSLGKLESGGELAVPIWLSAMAVAEHGLPVREFDLPAGLTRAVIDRATGAPACRTRSTWFVPQRCEWFGGCSGGGQQAHAPFLDCSDPERWLDEVFLPGTEPRQPNDPAFGPRARNPDPDERGAPPPIHTEVGLTRFSLFELEPDQVTAESIASPLAARRRAIETAWRRVVRVERAERAQWGWPALALGTRVRVRVRLGLAGVVAVEVLQTSGDAWLDGRAQTAIREGLATLPVRLPRALFEPAEQVAELEFELVVGDPALDASQARP